MSTRAFSSNCNKRHLFNMENSLPVTGDYQFLDSAEHPDQQRVHSKPRRWCQISRLWISAHGTIDTFLRFLLGFLPSLPSSSTLVFQIWLDEKAALGLPALEKGVSSGPVRVQAPQSFLCY